MNKEIVVVVMIAALVILSGIQAVQINDLKEDIQQGNLGISKTTSTSGRFQARSAPPLTQPSMVGGC